jgi:hypothetical protein
MRKLPKLTIFALAVVGAQKVFQILKDLKAERDLDRLVDETFNGTPSQAHTA